ncbi:MAG: purple acid phosphatase family protein [Promethearchaeota archaeon]
MKEKMNATKINVATIERIDFIREIKIRIRTFFLSILILSGFFIVLFSGHIGPWLIDQDYYQPHLTWDGSENINTSITINFRTPLAQCGVEYQIIYDNGTFGAKNYVNETENLIYHHITLTGLEPNTRYRYRILDLSKSLNNRVRSDLATYWEFKTAKTPSAIDNRFKFIVFGDNRPNAFGTGQCDEIVKKIMAENDISFVINTGDLILMGGGPDFWWKRYFMENFYMRSILTLPTKGNHEIFGIEDNYTNTEYEFNHDFPNHQNWYSLNYSNVHFICLEFTDYKLGAMGENRNEEMRNWLREDLKSINTSSQFDFIVVYMHYPLQTLLGGNGVNINTWESICGIEFRNANVVPDIFFTGHVHDYERSRFNLGDYNGDGIDDFTWNIISGGGGAELAPLRWTPLSDEYYKVELLHHYIVVEVENNTMNIVAKTPTGQIIDEFQLTK